MPEHWRKPRFLGGLSLVVVAAVMMVATDATVAAPITDGRRTPRLGQAGPTAWIACAVG